ncbi:MAG: META domain-containing protein [Treponema sp.]|jgi:hypothetical protein|nr:META domain-containing protein [Treponema sp.]
MGNAVAADRPLLAEDDASSFDSVAGKEWRLMELRGGVGFSRDPRESDSAGTYTLKFQDGMASGRGAPNLYRFPFEAGKNQSLGITSGIATLMAPFPEPEGFREGDYFDYLTRVYRWALRDGRLELHTKGETGEEAVLVYGPVL